MFKIISHNKRIFKDVLIAVLEKIHHNCLKTETVKMGLNV